jgi:hypothetical protein
MGGPVHLTNRRGLWFRFFTVQPVNRSSFLNYDARSREGTVIGSDQRLGPTQRKCGRASNSDVQQSVDLLWVQVTTSVECKKVSGYSLLREGAANMVGKEPIEALINL